MWNILNESLENHDWNGLVAPQEQSKLLQKKLVEYLRWNCNVFCTNREGNILWKSGGDFLNVALISVRYTESYEPESDLRLDHQWQGHNRFLQVTEPIGKGF